MNQNKGWHNYKINFDGHRDRRLYVDGFPVEVIEQRMAEKGISQEKAIQELAKEFDVKL